MNDNDKRNLCTGCGLMPQKPVRPKPPVCGCKKKKCCKKDCCENEFAFRKVVIPVALGDDVTGKAKPENGAYTNSYVEYEANGAQYMYDSYGVYTKIEGGGGGGEGTLDFNELENRPKYAGEEMTGDTNIPDVATAVSNEASLRAAADAALQGNINGLANRVTTAEGEITTIEGKIPEQASATNQLADKNFVNSSIATNTANFIGTFNSVAELEAYSGPLTNNDYAFVIGTDAQGNTVYDRYKYNANTEEWAFEYELNNSSFTANQWAAINSGITSGDVTKLSDLANIKTIGNNLTLDANGELSATDTVYNDFTGTDGVNAGTAGLVPAPAVSDAGKYLKSDGTWDSVSGGIPTTATFWGQSYDATNNRVSGDIDLSGGGSGGSYSIYNSATSSQFTNQSKIQLQNGVAKFTIRNSDVGTFTDDNIRFDRALYMSATTTSTLRRQIKNMADPTAAQDAATKNYADNLAISYAALNGTAAPTTATEGKYIGQLYYDTTNDDMYYCSAITAQGTTPETYTYTWLTMGGGPTVVQTVGTSTTDVMSQAATTNMIFPSGYETSKSRIAIGNNVTLSGVGIAVGNNSKAPDWSVTIGPSAGNNNASERNAVYIGRNAGSDSDSGRYNYSVALGSFTRITRASEVSVGGSSPVSTRFIANVTDPTLPQDAATKNYADNLVISYASLNGAGAPTTATEAKYVGQLYYDTTNDDMYYCSAITAQGTTPETYTYTWLTMGGGPTVVQAVGTSTTDVMSQDASTKLVYADADGNGNRGICIPIIDGYSNRKTVGVRSIMMGTRTNGADLGNNNISIGYAAGPTNNTITSAVCIGSSARTAGASAVVIGNGADSSTSSSNTVAIGDSAKVKGSSSYSIAIGSGASVSSLAPYAVAIGYGATGAYNSSVAIGYNSTTTATNRISVGNATRYRAVEFVADPTNAQDAATKNYVDSIYPVGAVFTSTSATAPTIAGGTWTEIGTQTIGSSTVHYYERTA